MSKHPQLLQTTDALWFNDNPPLILRQPEGFPLREHVLVLNVGPAKEIASDHHGMVLFGGWDDHDEENVRGNESVGQAGDRGIPEAGRASSCCLW